MRSPWEGSADMATSGEPLGSTIPRKSLRDFAGLGVPGVMDDGDGGADALADERDVLKVMRAREG